MINIKGLNKAEVLKALYDSSHCQGMGRFAAVPDGTVTVEYCKDILRNFDHIDYLHGRVIKIDFSGDEIDERLYDRDNGVGAAARAIDELRNKWLRGGVTVCLDTLRRDIYARIDSEYRTLTLTFDGTRALDSLIHSLTDLRNRMAETE